MKPEFFKQVLTDTLEKIKQTLGVKSMEYVRNNNAMHNFDEGARMKNTTRENVIYGFALKHLISLSDIRKDIEDGKLPTVETVEEKYTDAINYLILEKASVLERITVKGEESKHEDAFNTFTPVMDNPETPSICETCGNIHIYVKENNPEIKRCLVCNTTWET